MESEVEVVLLSAGRLPLAMVSCSGPGSSLWGRKMGYG
jgi:hypothetical protein